MWPPLCSFLRTVLLLLLVIARASTIVAAWSGTVVSRRVVLASALTTTVAVPSTIITSTSSAADTTTTVTDEEAVVFQTTAYGRQEYTNAITASRDTNISPAEAYDVIRQRIPPAGSTTARAVDVGAGAGLSTAVLYTEKGYRTIAAVDWSKTAWDDSVTHQPATVQFYEMDDATFFQQHANDDDDDDDDKFDCIVYNFAVNTEKAVSMARQHLTATGVLLAPCNDRTDYWYKQSYLLLDGTGRIQWQSPPEINAWSVQFQPDVTSPTCTGIWCGNLNGFQQQQSAAKG
jgi:Methyltransferase domain